MKKESLNKEFMNECTDCDYTSKTGLWLIEGYEGPIKITEYELVYPESGLNPEHFDLNFINADTIAEKYNIKIERVEELIMNGEPCCPRCKSKNYFSK